jgi:uncharacterized protein YqkB
MALKHTWFVEDRDALNEALQINSYLNKINIRRFSLIQSNMSMKIQKGESDIKLKCQTSFLEKDINIRENSDKHDS